MKWMLLQESTVFFGFSDLGISADAVRLLPLCCICCCWWFNTISVWIYFKLYWYEMLQKFFSPARSTSFNAFALLKLQQNDKLDTDIIDLYLILVNIIVLIAYPESWGDIWSSKLVLLFLSLELREASPLLKKINCRLYHYNTSLAF